MRFCNGTLATSGSVAGSLGKSARFSGTLKLIAAGLSILAALLECAACAQTKSVNPVQISQPGDQNLTCAQIDEQIRANQAAAVNFANQAAQVEGRNTAFEIATIFTMWAAMGVDFSKEDQIKFRSLRDRNQYLLYLKGETRC